MIKNACSARLLCTLVLVFGSLVVVYTFLPAKVGFADEGCPTSPDACSCEYSSCVGTPNNYCSEVNPLQPYRFSGWSYPYGAGHCTSSSQCWNPTTGSFTTCSQCVGDYGDGDTVNCFFSCTSSCGSGGTEPPNPECWEG
ncbi:MAG: hypothetical protein ACD_22C00220G0009, partial [uncultured bacterium]